MRIIIAVFFIFFSLRNNAGANGVNHVDFRFYLNLEDDSILTAVQKISVPAENTTFRHVKVSGTKGEYIVAGESRTAAGSFFFTVEDGHVEYIKQTEVKTKGPSGEWHPFERHIHIPKEKLPSNGTMLMNLYERNREGKISQLYPVILENFK